jgi:hypothetical protein
MLTQIIKSNTDAEIFVSDMGALLYIGIERVDDRSSNIAGGLEKAIEQLKRQAKTYHYDTRIVWGKPVKLCPSCKKEVRYDPTDYGDYTCDHCGSSWTQFGQKAVKHTRCSNNGFAADGGERAVAAAAENRRYTA